MPEPRYARARNWTKKRRFEYAVQLIEQDGWTHVEACKEVGLSRSQFSPNYRKFREEREAKEAELAAEAAKAVQAEEIAKAEAFARAGVSPLGLQEARRVPGTFEEFDEVYFGHLKCPDCEVRHATPRFHLEIAEAVESTDPRVLINMPPYHSKTTNVSVKDTLRKICANPNSRTIIVSKTLGFASDILGAIKEMLTNEELYEGAQRSLIEDWGPFKDEDTRWSAGRIFVAGRMTMEKDPTVLALGVGGQIYGRRADEIKFDDIATLENQRNPESVLKILEWIDKEALSRIGKSGRAIWVGTRVAPGDIYYTLGQRPGYRVLRYPVILDDTLEQTLWPEHFPFSQALVHRSEMRPQDFQLIYQNVDLPGMGASFTPEMIDDCKDTERVTGHWDRKWRLIAGLDPAGGNKDSGYTAFTLLAVDLTTGHRYLVDQVAVKSMKAPQIRDQILHWSDSYPIYEWRVESNGLQSQLVQYNQEIIQALAKRGIRVVPHITNQNKWDPTFGVESMAPLMSAGLVSIPWNGPNTARHWQPFVEELVSFPMGRTTDRVMSWWFAELGCRQYLERAHLPMFDERATARWPSRIKRRRRVVDFNTRTVRPVKPEDQYVGHLSPGQLSQRRATVGRPIGHGDLVEGPPPTRAPLVNVQGDVLV